MKKLKIVFAGLLLLISLNFVGCKSNYENPDVQNQAVEEDSARYGYSGTGGFTN